MYISLIKEGTFVHVLYIFKYIQAGRIIIAEYHLIARSNFYLERCPLFDYYHSLYDFESFLTQLASLSQFFLFFVIRFVIFRIC